MHKSAENMRVMAADHVTTRGKIVSREIYVSHISRSSVICSFQMRSLSFVGTIHIILHLATD